MSSEKDNSEQSAGYRHFLRVLSDGTEDVLTRSISDQGLGCSGPYLEHS